MNISELFNKHGYEYSKFEEVENKKSSRPDIHAFIILNEYNNKDSDMVSDACHGEIWLDFDVDDFKKVPDDKLDSFVLELTRCGVRLDNESLYMFV